MQQGLETDLARLPFGRPPLAVAAKIAELGKTQVPGAALQEMQVGFQPQRIAARQMHQHAFDLVKEQFQDQLELFLADLVA